MTRFPRLYATALGAVAVALVCMTAHAAQPPGGAPRRPGGAPVFGMRGGQSLLGLCNSESVRQYAKISDQQNEQVSKLAEKVRTERGEEFRKMFAGMRDLSDKEREERFAQIRKEAEKRNQELESQLVKILGADKVAVLKRIGWQTQGPRVLLDPSFQEEMGFDAALKERLQGIADKSREEMAGLFGRGRGQSEEERAKAREKFEAAQKALGKQLMAALPGEMKAKLKEKMGPAIPGLDKMREEMMRARMRRGPGGGRPGGEGEGGRRPGGEGQGGRRPRGGQ
jgi:hypothetical protein